MKRALFVFAALAVVFAIAEIACRLLFPGLAGSGLYMRFTNPHREQSGFIPDDELFWKLKPGNLAWEVNADGFRGPPVPKDKPAGELRIVCLGDSCTFGLGATGVGYARTYPAVLQGILTEKLPGIPVRVLNFGCPGYTSFQGLRLLKSTAAAYHPDIVIAYFGINDGFDAVGFADKDQRPVGSSGPGPVLGRSYFYSALTRLVVEAKRALHSGAPLERVSIEDYHKNLDAMAAFSRSIKASIYFIAPPYLDERGQLSREDPRLHEPAVDVLPEMREVVARGLPAIFPAPDNVHPTPEGHAAIAATISGRIAAGLSRQP